MRPPRQWTDEDVVRRGQEWYDQHLRDILERSHPDAFVAIDVETGDYFIAESDLDATEAAYRQRPRGVFFLAWVGHPAAYRVAACRCEVDWVGGRRTILAHVGQHPDSLLETALLAGHRLLIDYSAATVVIN